VAFSSGAPHGGTRLTAALACAVVFLLAACASPAPSTDDRRVDLSVPSFSDPTTIDNPLFPASRLTQVVRLGEEGGGRARVEVTLLPETRLVTWNDQEVETVVSQFIAYVDGRVIEVALDFFAQADDGAVWYFGEEVDNYEDGVIANHAGSWLAGRDGPPGMIMPADPQVGDVFHPENIPDLVFEEVTVQSTAEELDGPSGDLDGGVRVEERLMEGDVEHKVYIPAYGEYVTEAEDELIVTALAIPIDALAEAPPEDLVAVRAIAIGIADRAATADWPELQASVVELEGTWSGLADSAPAVLGEEVSAAIGRLRAAVDDRAGVDLQHTAIDVALGASDLELRYRDQPATDLLRMAIWARRVTTDVEADDTAGARGDVAVLETIWARLAGRLVAGASTGAGESLRALRQAVDAEDPDAASTSASALIEAVEALSSQE
jgi:hypothetical protein